MVTLLVYRLATVATLLFHRLATMATLIAYRLATVATLPSGARAIRSVSCAMMRTSCSKAVPVRVPMIQVQRPAMNQAVQAFLRSPAAKNVRKEFGLPTFVLIGVGAFQAVMGCIEMITIVKFRRGLTNLLEGLTLKALRDQKNGSEGKLAELKPVIGHLVYGNPANGLGVVLGSLAANPNETTLVALTQQLGNLYAQEAPEESRKPMWRILKDDSYQPYRRRQLVEPFNVEPDATLFDVNLSLRDGLPTPWQTVMFAFVTTENEICQIPWSVVKPFITINPTGQ